MRIVVRIFDRNGLRRAFFFLLAGGTGFALYLCISNAMHYLIHVGETPSAIVGALLPVLPTFWMQRRFTFNSNYPKRKAFPRYVILQVANAVLIGGLTALVADRGAGNSFFAEETARDLAEPACSPAGLGRTSCRAT